MLNKQFMKENSQFKENYQNVKQNVKLIWRKISCQKGCLFSDYMSWLYYSTLLWIILRVSKFYVDDFWSLDRFISSILSPTILILLNKVLQTIDTTQSDDRGFQETPPTW
jgi:hypothetical protein